MTKDFRSGKRPGRLPLALFLLLLAPASVAQPPGAGEEPPKYGKVSGTVVHSGTGKPVADAPVRILERVVRTDPAGKFFVDNVPVGNRVLTSDVQIAEGGFLGFFSQKVRYWGFRSEWVEEGKEASVEIPVKKHGDVEKTCRACHPDRPSRTFPVTKCLHHSGNEVRPGMVAWINRYNEANEKAKSEKKEFFPPIRLEEQRRPDGTVYYTVNCESCHTAHAPAGYPRYVIAPYMERSVLCKGCHS